MLYMPLTIFFVQDYDAAIRAIVGEIILIAFYLLFRYYLVEMGINKFNHMMLTVGKYFYIISLSSFVLGMYLYFVKNIDYMPLFYPEQHDRVLGGIFNRWTSMPRLTGFSLGTYSFNWMSSFFILMFLQNKMYKWAFLGLACSLLTLSMTFILLLLIVIGYVIFKKGKVLKATILTLLLLGSGLYFYKTNRWFNYIIETRIENARTGTGRFEIWEFVVEKALERPVFGHGINQLKAYLDSYHDETIKSAHNTLFELFFNTGVIGLSIYVLFLVTFFIACYNLDKRLKGYYFKGFFLCYLVFTMSNTGIYIFDPLIFMAFIFLYSKETEKIKLQKRFN